MESPLLGSPPYAGAAVVPAAFPPGSGELPLLQPRPPPVPAVCAADTAYAQLPGSFLSGGGLVGGGAAVLGQEPGALTGGIGIGLASRGRGGGLGTALQTASAPQLNLRAPHGPGAALQTASAPQMNPAMPALNPDAPAFRTGSCAGGQGPQGPELQNPNASQWPPAASQAQPTPAVLQARGDPADTTTMPGPLTGVVCGDRIAPGQHSTGGASTECSAHSGKGSAAPAQAEASAPSIKGGRFTLASLSDIYAGRL